MKGHSLITPTKRDSHKDPVEKNADLNSGSPRESNSSFSSPDTIEGSNNSLYSPSLNSPLNTSASSDSPLNTSASSDSPLNTSASSDSLYNYNNLFSRTDSEGNIQNYFRNPIIKARAASQPHERKMIQWLNYYAKSLLEREEVGYLNLYVDDIEVHVAKAQEGIFIKISETTYLLSETELTIYPENNHVSDITSPILKEMMARGRLQELSKAATHFSALSRLSKMSRNEAPRLGKTEIFDNFEYHDALLRSIEEASNTQQLTKVIERAIVENDKKLSTAIRKINPVVSALRDIRADLTSSELADGDADGDFEKYKTTFVAPYTESHLVVTIKEKSAIVHIITHAEISKFTINLSNQNIGEEQKSSIINFIGNQIRGVDTDKTLDGNLKEHLQKQLAEKLKNPQYIELQPDPILEVLEKDFAALEESTRKIQRNVRGGLLRKVQTQEAKLKKAFEAAALDIFGTIDEPEEDEPAESYEGLEIFKKDGKLEVKQPPKMRNAYKDLLGSKPANSDRVKIFEESEALRGGLPCTFTFKGNNLFLRNDKANIAFHNESEKIRTFRKHELEDELEILKLFLETQRKVELDKFEEALNGFFTPESLTDEFLKLKEEYSNFVELEETSNGDIKLITRQGVTFITYATNRSIVSAEENVIYPDSTIHDLKKATEVLGEIKAEIQKQKIGNLFVMARALSPYGDIVIVDRMDQEGKNEKLSLTSKITDNTTYSVNLGDQIYYISEDLNLVSDDKQVEDPQIIEKLKTHLEAAITKVTRAQAEFRTVVESVFSNITEMADYYHSTSEIKPFRKIGAANDEDKASFEATLPISENNSQSYYFKSGDVVRRSNDGEALPVKFADLVLKKLVAEEFIKTEKEARLAAINQMAGQLQLIVRISGDKVENFETKLKEATGLEITANQTITFKNKDIEFIFNEEGSPQPFLKTNGSESTLHDLQLAQERLDEIYREAAVITLYDTLEKVSEEIFGDSKEGEYRDEDRKSFISRQQDGRRTFSFQPAPGEASQTFTFENGKLKEEDPKIHTETLYETSDRLRVFALEQSSLNAKKLRNTLAAITQQEDGTYINEDYIEVSVIQEGVQVVKLSNTSEIFQLSYKFTDVNTFLQAGIGLGNANFEKNASLHQIIEAQILADQIAKQIAKKRFEDAMHQMVDKRTDSEVEGSIHSYRDDKYEYEDLGNGVLTFTDFSEDPQFKSIYKKLSDPTLSHVSVDDNTLREIEEKFITQELNNLSQTIEQEVENKRVSLNSEIAKNLNSMLSDENPEVVTEAQTILRQEDDDSVKFTITDKTSGKQKVFKLDEYNNVLIDDKPPSIARLDDLLKEIQKSNTKDLYDKAAALVPYDRIDFTYNNGSYDVNSSLTVEKLAAEEGESAPLAVIISEGNKRYYLEENGLFESDYGNTKGEKITNPQITQSIKAQLDHASEAILLKRRLLSELIEASNDFLGSGEIDKYTRDDAIFSKEIYKDEFEFGTQNSTNKIRFENSQLVEPKNISNAGLIKILNELSTLRESAQVCEYKRLKEQYNALIGGNTKYLDIEDGRISIKDNDHELTTPPAVTCKFQNETYEEIAEVSIEATEPSEKITNSKSICDILKAQEALAKLQQHIEKIKEREAANSKRRSRTTSFKTTFHAVAPKTAALAELAKISHEEIPQNKLMHALDKLFKNCGLIPKEGTGGTGETKKIEKLDRANKSTLVKHSLEILKKDEIKNTNEIKKLSSYQPNSHNRQDVEELEEKAKNILVEYYKEHEPEKNEMVEKIKLFKATQKEFARGIHDKTSGFKSTDGKPSTFLSDQYAELLQEHKKQTSGSRGGGQR